MSSFEKVRTAVECILVRSILVPAVLIVGLKIEVMTERLGIDESSAQRRALGILIITLVYDLIRPCRCFGIPDLGQGLVQSEHLVVAEAVAYIGRDCSSRLSKLLSEEVQEYIQGDYFL